jgi:hypothetical protein
MNSIFIIDSGASKPMCKDISMFDAMQTDNTPVKLANGTIIYTKGKGRIGNFNNIFYIPDLKHNLLSVGYLNDLGYSIIFNKDNTVFIKDNKGKETQFGYRTKDLFYADSSFFKTNNKSSVYSLLSNQIHQSSDFMNLIHNRTAHINQMYVVNAVRNKLVTGLNYDTNKFKPQFCEGCSMSKSTRVSSSSTPGSNHNKKRSISINKSNDKNDLSSIIMNDNANNINENLPFYKVCIDLKGPLPLSVHKYRYMMICTCYNTRYRLLYCLQSKDECQSYLKLMIQEIITLNFQVKIIKSDNGREFLNETNKQFFIDNHIKHELTSPYTPHQNGIAERSNRYISELIIATMYTAKLPIFLWPYIAQSVITITNFFPNKHLLLKSTPYIKIHKKIPDLSFLRVLGCDCYVHLPDHDRPSFGPRAVKATFIGYDYPRSLAYIVYYNNKIYRTGHVHFNEDLSYKNLNDSDWIQDINQLTNNIHSNKESNLEPYSMQSSSSSSSSSSATNISLSNILPTSTPSNTTTSQVITNNNNMSTTSPLISNNNDNNTNNNITSNVTKKRPRVHAVESKRRSDRIKNLSSLNVNTNETVFAMNAILSGKYNNNMYETFILEKYKQINASNEIVMQLDISNNSPTIEEAKLSSHWSDWRAAMMKELQKLNSLHTWDVVTSLPLQKKAIKFKWVLKMKVDMFNSLIYKARLTAKGYSQKPGIDFNETFSPVARFVSVRLVLALAARERFVLWQYDVESAFPNAPLDNTLEIFMEAPEELNLPRGSYLRLRRALYGLKQASREWNILISNYLITLGFTQLISDSCIYKQIRNNSIIILVLYVDDIILATSHKSNVEWFRIQLEKKFIVKNTQLKKCLGIDISYDIHNRVISISKNQYIQNFVEKYLHLVSHIKYRSTPMDNGTKLDRDDCPKTEYEKENMKQYPYREVIGALNYLVSTVRPDLSFSVNYLARFMDNPGIIHWNNLLNIIAYLRDHQSSCIKYGILNDMTDNELKVYVDADHATTDIDNRKSVTSYLIYFNGGIISWKTSLQKTVSVSSTEAEYKAIYEAGKEVIWISQILDELNYPISVPSVFYEDNSSAIHASENPVQHSRLKHIDIVYHQIREWVNNNKISLTKISTVNQRADALNKASTPADFKKFTNLFMNIG